MTAAKNKLDIFVRSDEGLFDYRMPDDDGKVRLKGEWKFMTTTTTTIVFSNMYYIKRDDTDASEGDVGTTWDKVGDVPFEMTMRFNALDNSWQDEVRAYGGSIGAFMRPIEWRKDGEVIAERNAALSNGAKPFVVFDLLPLTHLHNHVLEVAKKLESERMMERKI